MSTLAALLSENAPNAMARLAWRRWASWVGIDPSAPARLLARLVAWIDSI